MLTPRFRIGEIVVAIDAPRAQGRRAHGHPAVTRAPDGSCRACLLTMATDDELEQAPRQGAFHMDAALCARVPTNEPQLLHAFARDGRLMALAERAPPPLALGRVIDGLRRTGQPAPIAMGVHLLETLARLGDDVGDDVIATTRFQPLEMGFELDGRFRARPRVADVAVISDGPGVIRGDFRGMAREVVRGLPSTGRSPMVAVGYAVHWLLTLEDPYGARHDAQPIELVKAVAHSPRAQLATKRGDVPAPLAALVDALLAAEPAERPPTFSAIGAEVRDVLRAFPMRCDQGAAFAALLNALLAEEATRARREQAELAATRFDDLLTGCQAVPGVVEVDMRQRPRQWQSAPQPSPVAPPADTEPLMWQGDGRAMRRASPRLYVDLEPVTCAAYARFLEDTGRRAPSGWPNRVCPLERADQPVVQVSLEDARAYARWAKKRLPLNDDWMAAMRELGFVALGGGRVWEWTASRQQSGHVVRGGRYRDQRAREPTMLHQSWDDAPADDIGFRCVAEG